jgi:predicted RNase H-like HicB family nuclease
VATESSKEKVVGTKAMALQRTIKAVVRPGKQSGYVAECVEIPVVTQGGTLDEVTRNLREAVELHLEGEDLAELGLAPSPSILVTFELEAHPATALTALGPGGCCHLAEVRLRDRVTTRKSHQTPSRRPRWPQRDVDHP